MVWLLDLGCVLAGLALILTECWVRLHPALPRARAARTRVSQLFAKIEELPDAQNAVTDEKIADLKATNLSASQAVAAQSVPGEAGLGIFSDVVKKDVFLAVGALLLFVPLLLQSGYNFTVGSSTPDATPTATVTPPATSPK